MERTEPKELQAQSRVPTVACPRQRKIKGIFYTPGKLSQLLSDWAIRSDTDKVLEPSFGGCVFISAVVDKLSKLLCKTPEQNIFGCDVDEDAFLSLEKLLGQAPSAKQFLKQDFLTVQPSILETQVEVVIGNPPYISRHNMSVDQRSIVDNFITHNPLHCPRVGSLWAYFVLHSISFLKLGGRMAFVLPGSLINSQYGRSVLDVLPSNFEAVTVILVRQRLFLQEGTDESTTILLCEGKGAKSNSRAMVKEVASLSELATLLNEPFEKSESNFIEHRHHRFFQRDDILDRFLDVQCLPIVKKLGDLARISIGVVTGDNELFVIKKSVARKNGLSVSDFPKILSKFRFVKGLQLSKTDLRDICAIDERCILVTTDKMPINGTLRNYLYKYPRERRLRNRTFAKRGKWFCPGTEKIPDAFFPYMHHAGPQIIFNEAKINCTNTIHRVFFNSDVTETKRKTVAISLLSSFSQLSAEIAGRSYGSGVLKHEPSEAMNIQIILPEQVKQKDLDDSFEEISQCLKREESKKASMLANRFISKSCRQAGLAETLSLLEEIVSQMRASRAPIRKQVQ